MSTASQKAAEAGRTDGEALSPLRVRLLVFIALAAIAVVAIWFIDRRAMIRMDEIGAGYTAPVAAVEP